MSWDYQQKFYIVTWMETSRGRKTKTWTENVRTWQKREKEEEEIIYIYTVWTNIYIYIGILYIGIYFIYR